jgi:NodT family efflux transporter outer membrane factor (OMF) lipoprotein
LAAFPFKSSTPILRYHQHILQSRYLRQGRRRQTMMRFGLRAQKLGRLLVVLALVLLGGGCTSLSDFVHNGFKVGPNYERPPAPLAPAWIDAANPRVKSVPADYSAWWTVFQDPVLNELVRTASVQNVNLRVAASRVLQARAQYAIAVGELFPQQQAASGSFTHVQASGNIANVPPQRFFDDWTTGMGLSWELDFWGKIRRAVESATDVSEASVDDYDNVMVTLIGDVATAYVQYRVFQQEIAFTKANGQAQRGILANATAAWKSGKGDELPVVQSTSLLEQLNALIETQEIGLRQASNALCILLGMPPTDLAARLGQAPIPQSPPEVVVGIPADLIRRRPDVRSAERLVAAQNAEIGVAEANLYPAFFINGTIGYEANDLSRLFASKSFTGTIGPAFQWQILNYGRLLNNVRFQDFKTQELVATYQQKVLTAAQEVENGIVTYVQSQREAQDLAVAKKAAERSVKITTEQFNAGLTDMTPEFVMQQFLAQVDISYAQSLGDIALGLIAVYRALGGGWEIRLGDPTTAPNPPPHASLGPPRLEAPGEDP